MVNGRAKVKRPKALYKPKAREVMKSDPGPETTSVLLRSFWSSAPAPTGRLVRSREGDGWQQGWRDEPRAR
jgi:hypothetical protein